MPKGSKAIGCPFCRPGIETETRVESSPAVPGADHELRRFYRCQVDETHTFWTVERIRSDVRGSMTEVLVRRPDYTKVFDPEVYRGELSQVALGLLSSVQVDELKDAVLNAARTHARTLDTHERDNPTEQDARASFIPRRDKDGNPLGVVENLVVQSEVLANLTTRRLREMSPRLAHVLYAMLFLGRIDLKGRIGFYTAAELLRWLFADDASISQVDPVGGGKYGNLQYPDGENAASIMPGGRVPLRPVVTELVGAGMSTVELHLENAARRSLHENIELQAVRRTPQLPRLVTKMRRRDNTEPKPAGPRETALFNRDSFEKSIKDALWGRRSKSRRLDDTFPPDSPWRYDDHRSVLARLISDWVLTDIAGQVVVTTSQLGTLTLRTLRRVDDLAYLRYAVKVKGFTRVSELVVEAAGLVSHPSRRLIFAAEGRHALKTYYPQTNFDEVLPSGQVLL